jgi:glycosyltransferase involved in cell wall biosynthesis
MRILLINYRYFISGGPERYMFNIKELLENHGHEVIPFSIKHNKNQYSEYSNYFMDAVGSGDEVYADEYVRDLKTSTKVIGRIIYSFEAKNRLKKLIRDIKPDLAYILHFQNKMSCSVIFAAKEMKIPVVQRISDFGHICQNSNSSFYLRSKREPCERCLHGSILNTIIYRCSDSSLLNSVIKTGSLLVMNLLNIKDQIDAFIFPSSFTMSKYVEFGVKLERANYIPTFFNIAPINDKQIEYKKYALFIGRLVPEKGLMTLIKAFENSKFNLKIIGLSGDHSYELELKNYLEGKNHCIEFLGEMNFNDIQNYLAECLFTIVPSEWYENLPNTILESYAFKKCVVATNIGSLKEAVIDNSTGFLFNYKDHISLREKIEILFSNLDIAAQYGKNGFEQINIRYSPETHYRELMKVFNKLVAQSKQ